jgi:hypothetical protein
MKGKTAMRGIAFLAALWTALGASPVVAEDDDWDGSRWEELDEPGNEKAEERPMMLGAQTLPAGRFGLRLSAGYPFITAGLHAGLADRVDLIAEALMPYTMLGDALLVGGGMKVNIFGHGQRFRYALKLRVFGILYSDEGTDGLQNLAPGLLIWPSFVAGFHVKEGCFYGEAGLALYPFIGEGSEHDYVFYGVPMHFGGEIYLTDLVHLFINVDFSFSIFGVLFTGLEGGVLFIL